MAKKEGWEVTLTRTAEKMYDRVEKDIRSRFDSCFEELEKDPFNGNHIKHLAGQLKGLSRYRAGDWRVICKIEKKKRVVEIIALLPRGDAYK